MFFYSLAFVSAANKWDDFNISFKCCEIKWDIMHELLLGAWHIVSIQEILIFVIKKVQSLLTAQNFQELMFYL